MSTATESKDDGRNARAGNPTTEHLSETAHAQTDRLAGAAHVGADRLASAAHDTIDKVSDAAAGAEQKMRESASRVAEQAYRAQQQATAAIDREFIQVKDFVRANPMTSAGIAFVAGIVVSAILRR